MLNIVHSNFPTVEERQQVLPNRRLHFPYWNFKGVCFTHSTAQNYGKNGTVRSNNGTIRAKL